MRTQKYIGIYKDLSKKINNGELRVNDLLPSENELCIQYDSSRETIRKALNVLVQRGFIHKVRGKGSIVLDVNKFSLPISDIVSFKEIAIASNKDWKTTVHELVFIHPDNYVKENLSLTEEQDIWRIVRSRESNGERIILDIDYVKSDRVPRLTKDICESSLYEYFEQELGLVISFAKKEITVEDTTQEDQEYLDLKHMTQVVVVKNFVYLDDATILQYTESRHRPDKFKFVDFARRVHK